MMVAQVRQLVDEIANLSLLDVSDLTTLLSKKLGVPMGGGGFGGFGGSFGGPMPGGPAGAAPEAAAAAAPVVEEKTEFDVKLTGFDAAAKIKVIKEVRAMTELGLKEAKELVRDSASASPWTFALYVLRTDTSVMQDMSVLGIGSG